MICSNLQGRLVILILISPIGLPLAARILMYTSIHFSQEQYVIGTPSTHCLRPSIFHNLQSTFPADNAMHPSGNGLNPLLGIFCSGIYRSAEIKRHIE